MKNFTFLFKTLLLTCLLTAWGGVEMKAAELTDVITPETFGYTSGTAYTDVSCYGSTSGTTYDGHLIVKEGYIQMRSNDSDTGLWTSTTVGTVKKIVITWNTSQSTVSRTLNIYGKNEPYTAASDLYSSDTQGTLIGQLSNSENTATLEVTGDYTYIGFHSSSGALYVEEIDITWEGEALDTPEPKHGYSPDDPYTCEEAIEIISTLASGGIITNIYVKGIVSTIGSYNSSWGELIYYISDDGTTTNQLEIYDGYYLNNEKFTSDYANELMLGDDVIVYGTFTNYNGNTPEGSMGSTYIYSLTRNGEVIEPGTGGDGGDDDHNGEVSASGTTVTLTNPGVSVGTETTYIDFTTMNLMNGESLDGKEFSFEDGSTVVFAKGNGTTAPAYYTSGDAIRVYADNTLTFTCSKCIAKIEMHTQSSSYDGNTATETADFSEDGTTAEYCNLYTSTSGGTQLRVQNITIYYKGEGGDEEPEPEDDGHTFNFADNTYGMTVYSGNDGNYETEVTQIVSEDGVVLNFDSGHYRLWNSSGEGNHLRIGGSTSSNNDAYFTISGPVGSKVLEVVVTSTGSSDNMSSSNPTSDPEGGSYASHVYTWTGEAESVTFHFTAVTHVYYIDVTLDTPAGAFTISSVGYATYYTDAEYTMPDGVKGTTIAGISEETTKGDDYTLTMPWEYTSGTTVPAGTALVLQGNEGTYTYAITSTGAAAVSENLLLGSETETTTTAPNGDDAAGYYFYRLANGSSGVGFYWGAENGAQYTSDANKAWLAILQTEAINVKFLSLGSEDDSTTGIQAVSTSHADSDAIYTLQGVRVNNMNQKGVYIVGGKKIIVK